MVDDVMALIDADLELTTHRDLFSSDEVADLLLDLRTAAVREPVSA